MQSNLSPSGWCGVGKKVCRHWALRHWSGVACLGVTGFCSGWDGAVVLGHTGHTSAQGLHQLPTSLEKKPKALLSNRHLEQPTPTTTTWYLSGLLPSVRPPPPLHTSTLTSFYPLNQACCHLRTLLRLGVILPSGGHLAIFRDIFRLLQLGRCYWHLVGSRPGMWPNTVQYTDSPTMENNPAQNVNSAKGSGLGGSQRPQASLSLQHLTTHFSSVFVHWPFSP